MVLTAEGSAEVDAAADGEGLWLSSAALAAATGFEAKPEGLCKGDLCVPVQPGMARGDEVDAAGLWRRLGHPVVSTGDGSAWYLGEGSGVRREQLGSLQAPDFTLPDKDGNLHSLSDHRGKKVFLATWASW